MHSHLHTEKNQTHCEDVIRALEECHDRPFLQRAFGACNDAKVAGNKCLRAARADRSKLTREQAKAKRARLEETWREIDMNS